ncbi:MAG: S-layer homology domain-containing protein, partial [Clostridiales bacterium]|nr:S-layer homology domain-containing protein [Clostridiales bacterium]
MKIFKQFKRFPCLIIVVAMVVSMCTVFPISAADSYNPANYVTGNQLETNNGITYAKLEGIGSSFTINNVNGGASGGIFNMTVNYAPENDPTNPTSTYDVIVNGTYQASFSGIGTGWFQFITSQVEVTLNAGTNTVQIVKTSAKVTHFANLFFDMQTMSLQGALANLLKTEYFCKNYTSVTENNFAKLNGQGTSFTMTGIDGGNGGVTLVDMSYCTEPNQPTTFSIKVNGVLQQTLELQSSSSWFDMKNEVFRIRLNSGKNNTIEITNTVGKVSHVNSLLIGDIIPQDQMLSLAKTNAVTYSFLNANPPATENGYAKINVGDTLNLTNIDGRTGGMGYGYIRCTTEPGKPTKLSVQVNDNDEQIIDVAGTATSWFNFFETPFATYLEPGTINRVSVQVLSGGITHFDLIGFGVMNGYTENPYSASIGQSSSAQNNAAQFLETNNIINDIISQQPKRQDIIVMLSRLLGEESIAANYTNNHGFNDVPEQYNGYVSWAKAKGISNGIGNGAFGCSSTLSQAQFLEILVRAMGYTTAVVPFNQIMTFCESKGIVQNIASNSYNLNSTTLDRNTMAAYVYNALYVKCSDGITLAQKAGIVLPEKTAYNIQLESRNGLSSTYGNNATATEQSGLGSVVTSDKYKNVEITFNVQENNYNAVVLGLRVNSKTHTQSNSGLWFTFKDYRYIEISAGSDTAKLEIPSGLMNIKNGAKIKIVDTGDAINIFSVIENANVPIMEIRFTDDYAVAYVRGHITGGVPSAKIGSSGYVVFGSQSGSVTYSNITATSTDPVQNLLTEYPLVSEGTAIVESVENFNNGIYDYNKFFATGEDISVQNGTLVFKGPGGDSDDEITEDVFSSIMRIKDGTLEADVLQWTNNVKFQFASSSNMSKGYYYCGLQFKVTANTVELYHCTRNMDENAMTDKYTRNHNLNLSNGYSAKITQSSDGTIEFYLKPAGG